MLANKSPRLSIAIQKHFYDCSPPRSEFSEENGTCEVDPDESRYNADHVVPYYEVAGVVCCSTSPMSVPVSYILAPARKPVVSFHTTSNQLMTDEHHYFFSTMTSVR
jgi:ABC-type branched-subunit amino acid transport system substrate-binding protein